MATFNTFGGTTYYLASSISSTATSIPLSSFADPTTGVPYTMALLNTSIVYATIAPKTSQSEFISFTGITQNSDGSALLTGVTRGLAKYYPFTESTDYKLPHAGQSQFIISDAPQVFKKYGALENNEIITGYWEAPDPLTSQGLVTNQYMLDLINGGTVSLSTVSVPGVAGETFSAGEPVYLKASDSRWYKALANDAIFNSAQILQLGISVGAGSAEVTITGGVTVYGYIDYLSDLSANNLYYISDTGTLSTSAGTYSLPVGWAKSTTELYFFPKNANIPTVSQKAALAGTSGTPGSGNKYVTNDDTSATASADKAIRANGSGVLDSSFYSIPQMPVPAFFQDTATQPALTPGTNVRGAFGSNSTGSVFYLMSNTSLFRFARDTYTGMYIQTHNITATLAIPTGDTGAIIVIGTFIYVFSNDGTNIVCSRFLAADLTGEQVMTVPTVGCTTTVTAWTDGTSAYLVSNSSNTTSRKWSVSGTTFSAVSTASVANITANDTSTFWDGTSAYVIKSSGFSPSEVYKLTNIDGSTKSTTNVTFPDLSDNQQYGFGISIDTYRMYIGTIYAFYDETAEVSAHIALFPISKP